MVELFQPRVRLLERLDEATALVVAHKDALKLCAVIVFGSLARGTADYRSDVDLMLAIDGTPEDSSKAKDYILGHFYREFEGEFPRIDAHTCRAVDLYRTDDKFEGTVYGDFLKCIEKDGIMVWAQ